jgi:hypothetical protein
VKRRIVGRRGWCASLYIYMYRIDGYKREKSRNVVTTKGRRWRRACRSVFFLFFSFSFFVFFFFILLVMCDVYIYRLLCKLYILHSSHRSSVASILFFRSLSSFVRVFAKFWNLSRSSSDKAGNLYTHPLWWYVSKANFSIWYIQKKTRKIAT